MLGDRQGLPALVLILGSLVIFSSCDDPLTPQEELAGEYEMTTLLVTEGGVSSDMLEAGVTIEIMLLQNGTTSGSYFIPAGNEDGSDLDADLAGTWTVSNDGERVTFDHVADTFLRDRDFVVQGDELVRNAGGIFAVLSRD